MIWRDASVQHFNSPDGHYKPGMAQDCQPIPGMSLDDRDNLHVRPALSWVPNCPRT